MMKLYQNIQNRRLELNLTQSELAYRVGYKDKGSISRIENGQIDLSQSQIEKFASALGCTPAFLMGWEESDKNSVLNAIESIRNYIEETQADTLTPSERELMKKIRKLDNDGLSHIKEVIEQELKYTRLRAYERKVGKEIFKKEG